MADTEFSIFPPYEAFYVESMLTRTSSALSSVELANEIIQVLIQQREDSLPSDWRRVLLDQMQNIVIQGGAISRFFWPPRDGKESLYKKRGRYLRGIFHVEDGSPLESRAIRNHVEHFDEKLDDYLLSPVFGHILPDYVGHSAQRGGIPFHVFRGYYLDSGVFQILSEKFEINPLVEEIARVNDLLEKFSKDGRLEPNG